MWGGGPNSGIYEEGNLFGPVFLAVGYRVLEGLDDLIWTNGE